METNSTHQKKKYLEKKVPLDLITGQRFYSSLRCVR